MQERAWLLGMLLVASTAAGPDTSVFAAKPVERFTAFAVDFGGVTRRGRTGTVDIVIERWSTERESAQLTAALREGGQDGLLRALRKMKDRAGFIRGGTGLGYPLQFALQTPLRDGGRRIVIATDRPLSFVEAWNRPRTVDYPFLVADIRLDGTGKGEGKLLPVAKITESADHVLEVENYDAVPVRLTSVRKVE